MVEVNLKTIITKALAMIKIIDKRNITKWLTSLFVTLLLSFSIQAENLAPSQIALQEVLAQHQGKVVYLDFWASWCVPCRRSFPWINKMQQQYHKQGFAVISVNLDADESLAKDFLIRNDASFPVIYDAKGHIAKYFKIKGMPSSMLIDREGKIRQSHSGFFINKVKSYETEIASLLKQ